MTTQFGPKRRSLAERFAGKHTKPKTGCWEWTAGTDNHGYGQIYDNATRGPRKAYRVAYELHVGPIPEGMQLDHLCRNRLCVNPAHLEPVTQAENIARGQSRATVVKRTGACERGHDASERVPNGPGKTRCGVCRRDQRAGRAAA